MQQHGSSMREASTARACTLRLRSNRGKPFLQEAKGRRGVTAGSVSLSLNLAVERDTHVTRVTTPGSKLPNATPGAISYADAASCDTGLLPEGEFLHEGEIARTSLA